MFPRTSFLPFSLVPTLVIRSALLDGEDEEKKNYLTILLSFLLGLHDTSTRYTYTTHSHYLFTSYSSPTSPLMSLSCVE